MARKQTWICSSGVNITAHNCCRELLQLFFHNQLVGGWINREELCSALKWGGCGNQGSFGASQRGCCGKGKVDQAGYILFSAGAILRHQVMVLRSCSPLLHRQPSSACSKSNIWLLKKQIFSPAIQSQTVPLTKHPFYLSSLPILSARFIGEASGLQGAEPGPREVWLRACLCGERTCSAVIAHHSPLRVFFGRKLAVVC